MPPYHVFIRRECFDWQLAVSRQCFRGKEVCPQTSAGLFYRSYRLSRADLRLRFRDIFVLSSIF